MVNETKVKKMWDIEPIPNEHSLFKRVHRVDIVDGKIVPRAFGDIGGGMSTEWSKYSDPTKCRNNAIRSKPEDNAVIELGCKDVRMIPLDIEHTPSERVRAHAEVIGKKTVGVRIQLRDKSKWRIEL